MVIHGFFLDDFFLREVRYDCNFEADQKLQQSAESKLQTGCLESEIVGRNSPSL